jgi:opacity protein-like surface antigen
MKNQLMVATMAIAFAANSFAADWRAIAEAAAPSWKATATGLEAKGPRYHDFPETALDEMDDNAYAYFQSQAVNLWQYAFLGDAKGKDYTLSATVRVLEPAPLKGVRPSRG